MKGRLLALDTETTGLDIVDNTNPKHPYNRITEIGIVEIIDGEITGRKFQTYLNPKREVSLASYKITGLSTDFLKDKPFFEHIVDDFLKFIQNSKLVIHNAKFDMKFLNFELSLANKKSLDMNNVIDTLPMARSKYPGQKASLDALCKRFNIDNSARVFHGALMDAQLLAKVYLYMQGFANQLNLNDYVNNLNHVNINNNFGANSLVNVNEYNVNEPRLSNLNSLKNNNINGSMYANNSLDDNNSSNNISNNSSIYYTNQGSSSYFTKNANLKNQLPLSSFIIKAPSQDEIEAHEKLLQSIKK